MNFKKRSAKAILSQKGASNPKMFNNGILSLAQETSLFGSMQTSEAENAI